ncbi:MAG TPA: glycosyltransferase, partial [Candidatus Nanoarchaeia archaeon]|nr:glycosyltransferase [Candidatus Nanoarchaeia archaeon]
RESTGNVIGWMDADLGMPPEDIPSLIRNIPEYDVAIGSRYAEGGRDIRDFKRRLTSRMINLFTNMLLGFSIKDFNSGFVFAKKKVFDDVHIMEKGYGQYCIRFLYDCLKKGYKIREIGYSFTERSKGVSKTGSSIWPLLKHGWNYGIEVIKIKVGRS